VDATVSAGLFLRREHRYDEARAYMHDLAGPPYEKYIFFRSRKPNLLRSGRPSGKSAAAYRQGLAKTDAKASTGTLHYEISAWGLGELLRSQKDHSGAAAAFELVSQSADPDIVRRCQKARLGCRRKCMTCCSSVTWR